MMDERPEMGHDGYGNRTPRRRGRQARRAPHPFQPRVIRMTPEELAAQSAGQLAAQQQGGEALPRGPEQTGATDSQASGYRAPERPPMFPPEGGAAGHA